MGPAVAGVSASIGPLVDEARPWPGSVWGEPARPPPCDPAAALFAGLRRGLKLWIVRRVVNAGGATDFCARFLDRNGEPVREVAVGLSADGK